MQSNQKRILVAAVLLLASALFLIKPVTETFVNASSGDGSDSSPYTVTQAMANQDNSAKTVEGYIVGQPVSTTSVITSNFPNDYAFALADNPSATNIEEMIYVQIPSSFRTSFGLQSNPSLLGEKVKVTGTLTNYFSHAGIKNGTAFEQHQDGTQPPETDPDPEPETPSPDGYYDDTNGKSGEQLKSALHDIIDDHTEISYSDVWEALRETDEDPSNSNNVLLLYTGRSQGKNENGGNADDWNREHVWAKSHGDFGTSMGPGTDLHHLRPTDASVNSSRSNLDFDEGGNEHEEAAGNYYDSDSWEPRDSVKGDVARMIFIWMYVMKVIAVNQI